MSEVKKRPYYKLEFSLFGKNKWKCYQGNQGCVPIDTPQTVSFERLAPGEKPTPPTLQAPAHAAERLNLKKLEEARQKTLFQRQKEQQPKKPPKEQPKELEAEKHEKIPVFDLQDIPVAMEKMGWPVAAKLAKKWFAGTKHIWDNDLNSVQPLDDTTVTLDWAMKFGSAKNKYYSLLNNKIYNEEAIKELKEKLTPIFENDFRNHDAQSFDTREDISDLRLFHKKWNFQHLKVTNLNTLDLFLDFTDLTASLANFNIYAALGNVEVWGDKYAIYENGEQINFCFEPNVRIREIFIYINDNYSFNDPSMGKSQYLGHWNKNGMVATMDGTISELIDDENIHTDMGNSDATRYSINPDYPVKFPIDKPVDIRTAFFKKLFEKNVYFPVYNSTFRTWREQHNHGMDLMVYSIPKYIKLKKPIEFKMQKIYRLKK